MDAPCTAIVTFPDGTEQTVPEKIWPAKELVLPTPGSPELENVFRYVDMRGPETIVYGWAETRLRTKAPLPESEPEPDGEPQTPKRRGRWFRVLMLPVTMRKFERVFYCQGEPLIARWMMAAKFAAQTIRR